MKKIVLLVGLCLPFIVRSQGITWDQKAISWKDVQEIARRENKFIFLDCYATWCAPCKEMDNRVYSAPQVASIVNERFIAVKLQLDSAKNDPEEVRNWYKDAADIAIRFSVRAFPTFLFFAPDGSIVHRDVGYKTPDQFLKVLNSALNSNQQFYTQLKKFDYTKSDFKNLKYLARTARAIDEPLIANKVASRYIEVFLTEHRDSIFTKDNLDFLQEFKNLISAQSPVFIELSKNKHQADEAIGIKNFTQTYIIEYLADRDEIQPFMKTKKEPDWDRLLKSVAGNYDQNVADRTVLAARISWHEKKENWNQVVKYTILQVNKFGVDTTSWIGDFTLNQIAYRVIFLHAEKPAELQTGIDWMKGVIERSPKNAARLDTYACLLYKAGKKKEAIEIEQMALSLKPNDKKLADCLAAMKAEKKIWLLIK